MKRFVCILFVVMLISIMTINVYADNTFALTLDGLTADDFDFDTSTPWCVRFARWYCEQVGLVNLCPYDYCDSVVKWDNSIVITDFNNMQENDWIMIDYNENGSYDHCAVYLGNGEYIGGNENNGVIYHKSMPTCSFIAVRFIDSTPVRSIVGPVDDSDTSGFKSILLSLIGPYDPIVNEYSYQGSNGYTSYIREITPDYIWMISVLVFLVVLYSIFRITYGLAVGGKK